MNNPLTIGSLFSGIGGLELGLERATGAHTVWNCEMDEFCRKVLAKHWPDAVQYTDVRDIDGTVEPVDLICGGFPCTNISVAGDRTGLAGEQSGLWHEYARIVRDLRPRFVFVENVTALRNFVSDKGLGRVLGDLAESGYDVEWDCVPAAAVGAPHVRDRIFILAWRRALADADDAGALLQRGVGTGGVQREHRPLLAAGIAHPFPPSPNSPDWADYLKRHPEAQPGIRRDADGVPRGLDKNRRKRLKALGNAVVPQAAARAWQILIERAGVEI